MTINFLGNTNASAASTAKVRATAESTAEPTVAAEPVDMNLVEAAQGPLDATAGMMLSDTYGPSRLGMGKVLSVRFYAQRPLNRPIAAGILT